MIDDPYTKSIVSATLESALKPLYELVEKLAGPVAEEIGLTLRDRIKVFRARRQMRLLEKTGEYIRLAGFTPQAVAAKLLLPIMDNAAVEDDEYLHSAWAALLANAAHLNGTSPVMAYFPELLKQLSPIEANGLNRLFERIDATGRRVPSNSAYNSPGDWNEKVLHKDADLGVATDLVSYFPSSESEGTLQIIVNNLLRLGILTTFTRRVWSETREGEHRADVKAAIDPHYCFTFLGLAFVKACRPPNPSTKVN